MTVLKLSINNCFITGILGFQETPFKKVAVSQSSVNIVAT